MMKWKVTKSSRSSSVDRSSVDCEISEGPDAAKPLPAIPPSLSKAEEIKKDEDTLALPPPSRRKHQHQNGGLRLSRKDSFAASDCIPINLKEILGISRQRSESHLNSLPVLNGERRRSRSEVRVSSADRLTVAYHGCPMITPLNKLTERNQHKNDQLPILNGRCPSPMMKNSRWLRGRQRQREPRKSMLGICGGVTKNAPTPNGRIPSATMDRKMLSLQETVALIHNSPPDEPMKESNEITGKEKNNDSKDNNSSVAPLLNGHAEKELDKENIKNCRKTANESNKQSKEGYRFRRNKGFAPRPGMRRSPTENDKDLNSVEEEITNQTEKNPGAKEEKDTEQHEKNSPADPAISEVPSENKESSGNEKEIVVSEKDPEEEVSKHCAKKRRDSSGAVVTRTSESSSDSKSFDDVREQLSENKTVSSPETENRQSSDFTERNNEKNNEISGVAGKKSESPKPEGSTPIKYLENVFDGDPPTNGHVSKGEKSPEDGKFGFYLHEDIKSSNEDLRVNLNHLMPPKKKKNSKSLRNSECLAKVKDKRKIPEENPIPVLLVNGEVENSTHDIPKDTIFIEKNYGNTTEDCDKITRDTVYEECEVEAQETMLDSLVPAEGREECMDTHHVDASSKIKLYCPSSPPPKKKMASHQGMTVSVVVRKPSTSEEILQPVTSKQSEISSSESFVVKKSFVLTIAKQEMGFRSMCANKEACTQAVEITDPGVKKEEHQISVTFLCAGDAKEPCINGQTSTPPMNDMRLRSFSMPPTSRHHQQQNLLCLESVRSRSKERRNKEKQTIKRKSHRQRKKDTGFHMPKAVIDELSKVLEKRKRCIEDDDDEDDDYYDEDQDGESE